MQGNRFCPFVAFLASIAIEAPLPRNSQRDRFLKGPRIGLTSRLDRWASARFARALICAGEVGVCCCLWRRTRLTPLHVATGFGSGAFWTYARRRSQTILPNSIAQDIRIERTATVSPTMHDADATVRNQAAKSNRRCSEKPEGTAAQAMKTQGYVKGTMDSSPAHLLYPMLEKRPA